MFGALFLAALSAWLAPIRTTATTCGIALRRLGRLPGLHISSNFRGREREQEAKLSIGEVSECVCVCGGVRRGGCIRISPSSLPQPLIHAFQQPRPCRHGDGSLAFSHEALLTNNKITPLFSSRLLATSLPSDPVMPPAHLGCHACACVCVHDRTFPFPSLYSLVSLSCKRLFIHSRTAQPQQPL